MLAVKASHILATSMQFWLVSNVMETLSSLIPGVAAVVPQGGGSGSQVPGLHVQEDHAALPHQHLPSR